LPLSQRFAWSTGVCSVQSLRHLGRHTRTPGAGRQPVVGHVFLEPLVRDLAGLS
jgi:hypothetical protein